MSKCVLCLHILQIFYLHMKNVKSKTAPLRYAVDAREIVRPSYTRGKTIGLFRGGAVERKKGMKSK